MEIYLQNQSESFDAIFALGDNMYAKSLFYPTQEEKQTLMNLFSKRDMLSTLPIYHVRGNHDFHFTYEDYQDFSRYHRNWLSLNKWYFKTFDLNSNNKNDNASSGDQKKALVIFLDTTIVSCGHLYPVHWNCSISDDYEAT